MVQYRERQLSTRHATPSYFISSSLSLSSSLLCFFICLILSLVRSSSCMAAYSQSRGLIGVGKQFLNQIGAGSSLSPPLLAARRVVHVSVYEKNPDDKIRGTVVPDDVIEQNSEKFWGPHPQTGVFGPSADHKPTAAKGEDSIMEQKAAKGGEDSIMEQKAFFRPLEDLEKPSEDSERPPML